MASTDFRVYTFQYATSYGSKNDTYSRVEYIKNHQCNTKAENTTDTVWLSNGKTGSVARVATIYLHVRYYSPDTSLCKYIYATSSEIDDCFGEFIGGTSTSGSTIDGIYKITLSAKKDFSGVTMSSVDIYGETEYGDTSTAYCFGSVDAVINYDSPTSLSFSLSQTDNLKVIHDYTSTISAKIHIPNGYKMASVESSIKVEAGDKITEVYINDNALRGAGTYVSVSIPSETTNDIEIDLKIRPGYMGNTETLTFSIPIIYIINRDVSDETWYYIGTSPSPVNLTIDEYWPVTVPTLKDEYLPSPKLPYTGQNQHIGISDFPDFDQEKQEKLGLRTNYATNVGTYNYTIYGKDNTSIPGKSRYCLDIPKENYPISKQFDWEITPMKVPYKLRSDEFKYNGGAKFYIINELPKGYDQYFQTLQGGTLVASDIGKYSFFIRLLDTTNYVWDDVKGGSEDREITWSIVESTGETYTPDLTLKDNVEYDGEPHRIIDSDAGTWIPGISKIFFATTDNPEQDVELSDLKVIDANTYSLWYKVESLDGYIIEPTKYTKIDGATFIITQRTLPDPYLETTEFKYEAETEHTPTIINQPDSKFASISGDVKAKTKGKHTIKISVNNPANCKWTEKSDPVELHWIIYLADVKPPVPNQNLIFTGEKQSLIKSPAFAFEDISITYVVSDSPETPETGWKDDEHTNFMRTDAGNYYVHYKGVRGSDVLVTNYIECKISPKKLDFTKVPSYVNTPYTGSNIPLCSTGSASDGTIKYRLDDGPETIDVPKAKNAGKYKISSYVSTSNRNYSDSDVVTFYSYITSIGAGWTLDSTTIATSTLNTVYAEVIGKMWKPPTFQFATDYISNVTYQPNYDGENHNRIAITTGTRLNESGTTVTVSTASDGDHNAQTANISISINTLKIPDYVVPVCKSTILRTDANKEILTTYDTTQGSIMEYALTANTSSDIMPSDLIIDWTTNHTKFRYDMVGTYTAWYRIVNPIGTGYASINPTRIKNKNNQFTVEIKKAPQTWTVNKNEFNIHINSPVSDRTIIISGPVYGEISQSLNVDGVVSVQKYTDDNTYLIESLTASERMVNPVTLSLKSAGNDDYADKVEIFTIRLTPFNGISILQKDESDQLSWKHLKPYIFKDGQWKQLQMCVFKNNKWQYLNSDNSQENNT